MTSIFTRHTFNYKIHLKFQFLIFYNFLLFIILLYFTYLYQTICTKIFFLVLQMNCLIELFGYPVESRKERTIVMFSHAVIL